MARLLPARAQVRVHGASTTGWLAPFELSPRRRVRARVRSRWWRSCSPPIPVFTMTVTLYDPRYLTPFLCGAALFAARGGERAGRVPAALGPQAAHVDDAAFMLSAPTTGMALHDAWREGRKARTRLSEERIGLAVRFSGPRRGPRWCSPTRPTSSHGRPAAPPCGEPRGVPRCRSPRPAWCAPTADARPRRRGVVPRGRRARRRTTDRDAGDGCRAHRPRIPSRRTAPGR